MRPTALALSALILTTPTADAALRYTLTGTLLDGYTAGDFAEDGAYALSTGASFTMSFTLEDLWYNPDTETNPEAAPTLRDISLSIMDPVAGTFAWTADTGFTDLTAEVEVTGDGAGGPDPFTGLSGGFYDLVQLGGTEQVASYALTAALFSDPGVFSDPEAGNDVLTQWVGAVFGIQRNLYYVDETGGGGFEENYAWAQVATLSVESVPLPATAFLLLAGLGGITALRRRG